MFGRRRHTKTGGLAYEVEPLAGAVVDAKSPARAPAASRSDLSRLLGAEYVDQLDDQAVRAALSISRQPRVDGERFIARVRVREGNRSRGWPVELIDQHGQIQETPVAFNRSDVARIAKDANYRVADVEWLDSSEQQIARPS